MLESTRKRSRIDFGLHYSANPFAFGALSQLAIVEVNLGRGAGHKRMATSPSLKSNGSSHGCCPDWPLWVCCKIIGRTYLESVP